ncbi:MAG: lysylphosphatidylglycerol synthase transmembrane domain-containing protein [Candidatus Diapherotrites archaeon]|nr:lysylphosphatidylglycerol synthase transmembrane domain-containing protein [Candidatus Diapherotrites archaeon]
MKKQIAAVGILILLAILLSIDLGKLFETLSKTDLLLFCAAVLMGFPAIAFRSLKWQLMLKKQGHSFSFSKIFRYYFIGIGLGSFTPGRLGDFAKALFVNKKIRSLSVSFSSVLVDRVVDLTVLVGLGALSICAFLLLYGVSVISIPVIIAMLCGLAFCFYLLFNKPLLKKVLRPFYRILVPEKFKEKLSAGFDSFIGSAQALLKNRSLLLAAVFLSLVSWLFEAASQQFLAVALGISLSFSFLFLVVSLSNIVSLLPVSVSGIGTRDALLIMLFSLQGIPAESAVAFSFLVLFSTTLLSLVGIAFMAFEKIELKELLEKGAESGQN